MTSGRHPLVGRALVNRIWMHHFGRGLVNTPGEFGKMGARRGMDIIPVDVKDAVSKNRTVDMGIYDIAKVFFG